MAIDPVASGAAPTPVASGDLTVPYPTGESAPKPGDIIVVGPYARDNVALSLPAGWSIKSAGNNGTGSRLTVAWKRYAEGDADTSVLLTHAAGGTIYGRAHVFRGVVGAGDPWEAVAGPTSAAAADPQTLTPASLEAVSAGAGLLVFAGLADNAATASNHFAITNAQGLAWSELDDMETVVGNDLAFSTYFAIKSAAGAQTGPTISVDPEASAVGQSWMGALTPEGAPASFPVRGSLGLLGVGR